jgi:hypothetical protein
MTKYYRLIKSKDGRDDRLHVPTHAARHERYECVVKPNGTLIYIPRGAP